MMPHCSRRRLLRGLAGATGLGATGSAAAHSGAGRSRAGSVGRRTGLSPDEDWYGFAPSWQQLHFQKESTRVLDVAGAIDGGIVAVGKTAIPEDDLRHRVWIGVFQDGEVRWATSLRAETDAGFPNVVAMDGNYQVFWASEADETTWVGKVTTVAPDGNVLAERELDTTYVFYGDVHADADGYTVVNDGPSVYRFDKEFTQQWWTRLSPPDEWTQGVDMTAVVPVSDGYVVVGKLLNADVERAAWAAKVTAGGSVSWSQLYELENKPSVQAAASVDGERVTMVGKWVDDKEGIQGFQVTLGPDGSVRNRSVLEGAWPLDVVGDGDVYRVTADLDDGVGVMTLGADGTHQSTWAASSLRRLSTAEAIHPLGENRYAFGGTSRAPGDDTPDEQGFVVRLQPNDPPVPSVSVTPAEPNATQTVTFDASETKDPDTAIEAYEWNLDGDSYAEQTGRTLETSFDEPGEHEVTFRAVDAQGAVAKETVSVSVGENTPPTATLSVSRESPRVGDEVAFTASEVTDAETSVASIEWDVDGDGSVDESGTEVTASFDEPGEYEVTATLADTAGKTTTLSTTVTVLAPTTTAPTSTAGDGDAGDGSPEDDGLGDGSGATPGFGVGSAVAALTAGAGALARRLREDD